MPLSLAPLTAERFARFGTATPLIAGGDPIRLVSEIENRRAAARLHLDFTTAPAAALPLSATMLERHPANSQSFIPLAVSRFLVLVAPAAADGTPDLARAEGFAATGAHAITYAAGIWHHPLCALDTPGFFAILTFRAGDDGDTALFPLPTPLMIGAP
jgi:ureidoglycolate lyase